VKITKQRLKTIIRKTINEAYSFGEVDKGALLQIFTDAIYAAKKGGMSEQDIKWAFSYAIDTVYGRDEY